LRGLAGHVGHADPAVAAFIGLVADLADHPEARVLLESLAPKFAVIGA
jgi:hypothetical protein